MRFIVLASFCVIMSTIGAVIGSSLLAWGFCFLTIGISTLTVIEMLKD